MTLILNGVKLPLEAGEASLGQLCAKTLGVDGNAILALRAKRCSLDARRKNDIHFLYTVEVRLSPKDEQRLVNRGRASFAVTKEKRELITGKTPLPAPVVIAGYGPAGIFAAYTLARYGYKPIVVERGKPARERTEDVERFRRGGALEAESNVMFGEGGAGAFSDGKLTTRIKDPRVDDVLETLVSFGAPADTAVTAKPHLGTDKLPGIISAIRKETEKLGGEVRFSTRLVGIETRDGAVSGALLESGGSTERLPCAAIVTAIGHSADDTYVMLDSMGLELEPKPFAIGARIEHPRALIDRSQYGEFMNHPRLGAAEYRMAGRSGDRGVYTFCMCPGGEVIACSNDAGRVITNGMSRFARDGENSNSAVVVQVDERDFGEGALAGLRFRERLERKAFEAGGGDYRAPASLVGDFLLGRASTSLGSVKPTYLPGVKLTELSSVLPEAVREGIRAGIADFAGKLRGFDMDDAVLTAIESRTSSPVRIKRDENGEATRLGGLFPAGEGAGYAGGIVSAAVDGIHAAERIIERFAPPDVD